MHIDADMLERERQLELVAAGIETERQSSLLNSERMLDSVGGKSLLKLGVRSLSDTLSHWLESHADCRRKPGAYKYIEAIGHEALALLMSRCYLGLLSAAKPRLYRDAVSLFANRALLALNAKIYEEKDANAAEWLYRRLDWQAKSHIRLKMAEEVFRDESIEVTISEADKLALGTTLVEICVDTLGLHEIIIRGKGKSAMKLLRVTPKANEWLANASDMNMALESFHLPMIIPPFDWTNLEDGGYLLKSLHHSSLVRSAAPSQASIERLKSADLKQLMAAVNAVQATPWRINQDVLRVWRSLRGTGKAGMSTNETIQLPEALPLGEDGHDINREARRGLFEAINLNRAAMLTENQKERVAALMQSEGMFYYPHNCDFRGRLYPVCGVGSINPQGDDSGKALLEFAEGKALGEDGLQWLYIHAQNTWGNDKVSLQSRIDATSANLEQYLAYARDPLANEGWHEADKPFCFLAACYELLGVSLCDSPELFISHLPIALDGTCSGLQHFAGIMLDPGLAKAVNVIGSGDKPQDIYQDVVANINDMLTTLEGEEADYWRGKITRDLVKQPVMCLSYGVTLAGMKSQIVDKCKRLVYRKGQPEYTKGTLNGYAAYLADLVQLSISKVSTSAFDVMGYLKAIASANAKAESNSVDGATHWVSPIGLPVTQDYYAYDEKRINVFYDAKRIRFLCRTGAAATDAKKQKQAFSPNFIHSMDASHLMMTVLACEQASGEAMSFAMIHDSFATHCCDTGLLFEVIREQYSLIYHEDVLMHLYEGLSSTVKDVVGPPPRRGSLNLDDVQASEYLFS